MFIFVTLTCALILTAIAIAVAYAKLGFPRAWGGLGFMGLAGIGGLAHLFFKKDPGKVEYDERDRGIQRKAALAGFGMAYLVVGIATMVPFTILGLLLFLPNTAGRVKKEKNNEQNTENCLVLSYHYIDRLYSQRNGFYYVISQVWYAQSNGRMGIFRHSWAWRFFAFDL